MTSQTFNTEDYLKTPEDIAEYLNAALEDGNERLLLTALQTVAKATGGMSVLAKHSQLNRESLYRALSKNGNPRLDTLAAILKTYGLRLSVLPLH